MDKKQIKIIYRRLFLLLVSIAGLYFIYRVRVVLIPFIFAFFIAYLLNPMVRYIEGKKVPKTVAVILAYLVVTVVVALIAVFGIPHMVDELNKLGKTIPKVNTKIQGIISFAEKRYTNFTLPGGIEQVIKENVMRAENALINAAKAGTMVIINLFTYLVILIIAPVFAFYFLIDIERLQDGLIQTIPRKYRSDFLAVLRDIDEIIRGFLRGHLLISVIVGFLIGLGTFIIGLDFSLIIGIISGIAELVPYIGPFLTAVPVIGLALLYSKKTALYAVIVLLVVQQLESSVIAPKILSKNIGIHPLLVVFILMAGGELYGLAGVLLAVPAAATLKVILRYIYLKLVDE
jgi:predicted PurR-regulated permease PerM